MGVFTLIYIPNIILFALNFFIELHNLELVIISLVFFIEIMIVSLVFKEVYDILFMEESRRDFEIEVNRKKYIEKEKNSIKLIED